MIRRAAPFAAVLALSPLPTAAQDDPLDSYVTANLLSIFYHELGHALIDIMALPVFGQEEDAADTASALMIDLFFEEDTAQSIVRDAAFGFLDEDAATEGAPVWWDTHGPDLQRYYNLVCQFYGGAPTARADLADALELPEDRAETCEEEFELADDSWGPVFDVLFAAGPGNTITYDGETDNFTKKLIAAEVNALNQVWSLPRPLIVTVAPCDEANAFYDLDTRTVTICTELAPYLREIAGN